MSTEKVSDTSTDAEVAQESDDSGSGPDQGPALSGVGAMPSGSEMAHWNTATVRADATGPGPVTGTVSKPMPGENNHAKRAKDAKVLAAD